jgi:hypothetical protein
VWIKIKMACLNDKGGISVGRYHLQIDAITRGLSPQKRLARQHPGIIEAV